MIMKDVIYMTLALLRNRSENFNMKHDYPTIMVRDSYSWVILNCFNFNMTKWQQQASRVKSKASNTSLFFPDQRVEVVVNCNLVICFYSAQPGQSSDMKIGTWKYQQSEEL